MTQRASHRATSPFYHSIPYLLYRCTVAICPQQATWSAWSGWSDCSVTCGTGHVMRTRKCRNRYNRTVDPKTCQGRNIGFAECVRHSGVCNGVDGISAWSEWGKCDTVRCRKRRTRTCDVGSADCASGSPREVSSIDVSLIRPGLPEGTLGYMMVLIFSREI